jgi:hypothetical protein
MTSSRRHSLNEDMVRVSIRDLGGHLIRVLDLNIVPNIVLQGKAWRRRMTTAIWRLWKSAE